MELKDIPTSWKGRCSGEGHSHYVDEKGVVRYVDNGELFSGNYRPCAKCGHYPTNDGDDYCLQHLGKVINACCGHGNGKGYIQFDNGIIIRGHFTIERD